MKAKKASTKKVLLYNLTPGEIMNPYSIIDDFFAVDWLKGHLKELKYWRKLLLTAQYYNKRNCPSNLLLRHRLTVKLMEAAWLLQKKDTVYSELFQEYSIERYREILYCWLSEGLSNIYCEDTLPKSDIIPVYENLQKLYETSWLIHERYKA